MKETKLTEQQKTAMTKAVFGSHGGIALLTYILNNTVGENDGTSIISRKSIDDNFESDLTSEKVDEFLKGFVETNILEPIELIGGNPGYVVSVYVPIFVNAFNDLG